MAQGPEVKFFETEFSKIVGDRECVAVNSGTSALHLSLLALGIEKGDEVIVPSFTFAATANVVALTGATPVFVDIEPRTFCMDPDLIQIAITKNQSNYCCAPLWLSCRHEQNYANCGKELTICD